MYTIFLNFILIKLVLLIFFYCTCIYRSLVSPEKSKLYQTLKQGDDLCKIQQLQSKLQVSLFKQKELLKKDILKKRALLEKELQIDIQVCILVMFFSKFGFIELPDKHNFLNFDPQFRFQKCRCSNLIAVYKVLSRRKELI